MSTDHQGLNIPEQLSVPVHVKSVDSFNEATLIRILALGSREDLHWLMYDIGRRLESGRNVEDLSTELIVEAIARGPEAEIAEVDAAVSKLVASELCD